MSQGKKVTKESKQPAVAATVSDKVDCPLCNKVVNDSDLALECEICDQWYHINCVDISEDEYTFLSAHKSVHWYCMTCIKNVANVIKLVSSLKQRLEKVSEQVTLMSAQVTTNKDKLTHYEKKVDEICEGKLPDTLARAIELKITQAVTSMESKVTALASDMKELKDQACITETKLDTAIEAKLVENISKSVDQIKKDMQPSWADIVGKEVNSKFEKVTGDVTKVQTALDETRKMVDEEKDHESRSHNVIIYRIPEGDVKEDSAKADKDFCLELFNTVLEIETQDTDFKHFRLGKRNKVDKKDQSDKKDQNDEKVQSDRPLMIQFREKTCKNRIMECLFKLKNADPKFKTVSITHDFTKSEREECKVLVEKAKKKQADEQGEYIWRVRGLPGQLKLVKLKKN